MTDKHQWYFDSCNPSAIPDDLLPVLDSKGIPPEHILFCVKSDLNLEMVRTDCYVLATDTEIIVISGSVTLERRPDATIFTRKDRLQRKFSELSYDVFPLDDLVEFKVEEQIASARFTAKRTDGDYELIANLSNTYKSDFYAAARYLGQLKKDGKITPDEKADHKHNEMFCPKCGSHYIDVERKICPKCMDKSRIISRSGEFVLKYKKEIFLLVLMLVLTSALGVLAPYISSGFYYDQVLDKTGKFYGQILLVLFLIIGTRLLNTFFSVIHSLVTTTIAANVIYDLKKVIFSSIERLSLSFFTNRQTGGLMTQVTRDANTIYWFFCDGVPFYLVNIIQISVILVILFIQNWKLTLLAIVTVPLLFLGMNFLFDQMDKYHIRRWTRTRQMNSVLSDILTGMRVVKAFSKEKAETERFDRSSRALAQAEVETSTFSTVAFPFMDMLFYISNLIVLGFGGWMVIKGEMTYGMLITFTAYMNMILSPLGSFVNMVYEFTDSLNAMSRLVEIMDAKPDVQEAENPVHFPDGVCRGKVEFRDVDFSYEKNRKVIDNVSFEVDPGQALGIVGHTGAGKSTLANLLIRLYDADNGEIRIDDINVRDLAYADLRANVSIVSQETYLFMGTILDNIRYARPEATEDEVIEAAKIAGAHDFIIKLPDAYSTMIGFGHKELSGGERQRVSIARAILRNPKILILDEATAAMDTETERKIQTALERLSEGRTTITIAHRLSTLRDADKLIVIENGKIHEAGTHVELLSKKGIYYNLYRLQMEAMKNIGIEE